MCQITIAMRLAEISSCLLIEEKSLGSPDFPPSAVTVSDRRSVSDLVEGKLPPFLLRSLCNHQLSACGLSLQCPRSCGELLLLSKTLIHDWLNAKDSFLSGRSTHKLFWFDNAWGLAWLLNLKYQWP
jgi:hypothetical protein